MNVTHRFSSNEHMMDRLEDIPDESYVAVGYPRASSIYRIRHVLNSRSGKVTHAANFVTNFMRYQEEARGHYSTDQLDRMTAPIELSD